MLKLKLQYSGHLMGRINSLEKTLRWERLKAGGGGNDRGWDGWMASRTQWTSVWASSGCWWWTEKPGMLQSMGSQRVGYDWATELNWSICFLYFWSCWIFIAARWLFSSWGEWRLFSSCSVRASHYNGFLVAQHRLRGVWASVVVRHSFNSCGTRA